MTALGAMIVVVRLEIGLARMCKGQAVDVRLEKEGARGMKGYLALLGRKSQAHTYLKAS